MTIYAFARERSETVIEEDSIGQWAEAGLCLCVHVQYILSAWQQTH